MPRMKLRANLHRTLTPKSRLPTALPLSTLHAGHTHTTSKISAHTLTYLSRPRASKHTMADTSSSSTGPVSPEALIGSVTSYVKTYMSKYDGSHDYHHIERVVGLARHIHANASPESVAAKSDLHVITLSALLHDVGDKKYLQPGQDAATMISNLLVSLGADQGLAEKVQTICLGVSYSSEIKNPAKVLELVETYPELGVVQDADRIDAIGVIGIGRTFTFGGARGARSMGETIEHFHDKLLRLEGMMKTDVGRALARERTVRMEKFLEWWTDEEGFAKESGLV